MRKETLLAIIAGISIGIIIAFGVWKVTQIIKKDRSTVINTKQNVPSQNNLGVSVSNLNSFDIVTQSPFKLSGIAKPNDQFVISTFESDYLVTSQDDGSFETEIEFPAGLSEINVDDKKIPVVFSTEFDEVAEKSLKKTAYVGTITDISSGNIQIKSHQGDIKQMATSDETIFINTLKKNVEIKSTDLAIGDYIVAMGLLNGNKVLDAKRILITGSFTENKAKTVIGKIDMISKSKLVIDEGQNEIFETTLPKKWIGPNTNELKEGENVVIVVLPQDDKTYTLRTIFTAID